MENIKELMETLPLIAEYAKDISDECYMIIDAIEEIQRYLEAKNNELYPCPWCDNMPELKSKNIEGIFGYMDEIKYIECACGCTLTERTPSSDFKSLIQRWNRVAIKRKAEVDKEDENIVTLYTNAYEALKKVKKLIEKVKV